MKRSEIIASVVMLITIIAAIIALTGWLVFYQSSFQGKIIDAETKDPIEGVVVVAVYRKSNVVSGPGGRQSRILHINETTTDKNGTFRIGHYLSLMGINSMKDSINFIVFKPGYASYPNYRERIYPLKYCGPTLLFVKEPGSTLKVNRDSEVIPIASGVIEMPKLLTEKERLRAIPMLLSIKEDGAVPLLNKAINEERLRYGLNPIGRRSK